MPMTGTPEAKTGMERVRSASKSHLADQRAEVRRAVIAFAAVFAIIGIATLFASHLIGASNPMPTAQERQMAPSAATARTGKIIFDTQGRECRQVLFDNQTGKTVSTEVPCDNAIAQDNKRAPIAEGTMRRIESISRSFAR